MILQKVHYAQHEGNPQEWRLQDLSLGPVNLLVGKNASGKTRALNILNGLARLVSGDSKLTYTSGNYSVHFEHDGKSLQYILHYENTRVVAEQLTYDGRTYLDRGLNGIGKIYTQTLDNDIDFQTPDTDLAVVARRDSIQHGFIEPLYLWGKSARHFAFGSPLGKNMFPIYVKDKKGDFDPRNTNLVVEIYKLGKQSFGEPFDTSIKDDMGRIGYEIEDIGLASPVSISVSEELPGDLLAVYVKEKGLLGVTDQHDMSQGMFRALSVIIQINYSERTTSPSCLLIDDIGEGLDFDRSCALIKLLMDKTQRSRVQLVMSTNDRFVMNSVPLPAWSVLQRSGNLCRVYNYGNSKAAFDEFLFTGLNNFDFFATNFIAQEAQ